MNNERPSDIAFDSNNGITIVFLAEADSDRFFYQSLIKTMKKERKHKTIVRLPDDMISDDDFRVNLVSRYQNNKSGVLSCINDFYGTGQTVCGIVDRDLKKGVVYLHPDLTIITDACDLDSTLLAANPLLFYEVEEALLKGKYKKATAQEDFLYSALNTYKIGKVRKTESDVISSNPRCSPGGIDLFFSYTRNETQTYEYVVDEKHQFSLCKWLDFCNECTHFSMTVLRNIESGIVASLQNDKPSITHFHHYTGKPIENWDDHSIRVLAETGVDGNRNFEERIGFWVNCNSHDFAHFVRERSSEIAGFCLINGLEKVLETTTIKKHSDFQFLRCASIYKDILSRL